MLFWQTKEAVALRNAISYWKKRIERNNDDEKALEKYAAYSAKYQELITKKEKPECPVWIPPKLTWD